MHLLAGAPEPYGLSLMMQHVGRRFVRYINGIYRRSGTLWEGRFKASLVDSEIYFLRCCRYIECNPVRAAIIVKESNPTRRRRLPAFLEIAQAIPRFAVLRST